MVEPEGGRARGGAVPCKARGKSERRKEERPRPRLLQTTKSAVDIEREQEALLAKKYGGMLKRKAPLMPKVMRDGQTARPPGCLARTARAHTFMPGPR